LPTKHQITHHTAGYPLPGAVSPYLFQMNNLKLETIRDFTNQTPKSARERRGRIVNLLAYQQVAIIIEF